MNITEIKQSSGAVFLGYVLLGAQKNEPGSGAEPHSNTHFPFYHLINLTSPSSLDYYNSPRIFRSVVLLTDY